MGSVAALFSAMFDIDAKTWTMILFVTGLAIWIMRQSANLLQLLAFVPAATLLSVITNHVLVVLHVYEPAKLADWMVWIIAASTVGNLIAIGMLALTAGLLDREPAPAAKN